MILIHVVETSLEKCFVVRDPHIPVFHPVDGPVPPYKDCLDKDPLVVVRTSIVTIIVDVLDY